MTSLTAAEYKKGQKRTGKMPSRRAAKRDASEPEIVSALEQCGFSVIRLDQPADLLVGFRGRAWVVECKTGTTGYGKDINDNQKAFARTWRGPPLVVLRSAQDAIDWALRVARGKGEVI